MRVAGFDHLVLNVSDVERSVSFYVGVLGLKAERLDEWRRKEVPFPSVRIDATTIIDLFPAARTGENLNHFCLVFSREHWEELVTSGEIDIVGGPSELYGARGMGRSVYTLDPDGNKVELRYYGS